MTKEKKNENSTDGLIINSENRTQGNTDDISEDLKEKDNMNEDNSNKNSFGNSKYRRKK